MALGEMNRRLVDSPVFLLSAVRSGSTLLRCVLDSHPQVYAPVELHLTRLALHGPQPRLKVTLDALGLSDREVEYLIWDRLLHELLARSGKTTIVEKTPANVKDWPRLAECWPRARYIFLLRNPDHVLSSMLAAVDNEHGIELRRAHGAESQEWYDLPSALRTVKPMLRALAEARANLPGITVRYEDLVTDPEPAVRDLCTHLDVPWEPAMLHYGQHDHGPYKPFLGDAADRIGSGVVLPPRAPSFTVDHTELAEFSHALGYGSPAPQVSQPQT